MPVGNRQQNALGQELAEESRPFGLTTWTEVPRLTRERYQVFTLALVAAKTRETGLLLPTVQEGLDDAAYDMAQAAVPGLETLRVDAGVILEVLLELGVEGGSLRVARPEQRRGLADLPRPEGRRVCEQSGRCFRLA